MCLHTSLWCYCLKELTLILLVGALILSKFLLLLKPPRIIPISSAVVYTHWGCRFPLPCWLESWFLTACLLHFSQKKYVIFSCSHFCVETTFKNPHFYFKSFLQACLCVSDRNHLSVISQLVWPLLIALVTAVLLLFLCFPSICLIHLLSLISNLNLSSLDKNSQFVMLVQCLSQCVLS